jgi:hypothetical protein
MMKRGLDEASDDSVGENMVTPEAPSEYTAGICAVLTIKMESADI